MNRGRRTVAGEYRTSSSSDDGRASIDLGMSLSIYSRSNDGTLVEIHQAGSAEQDHNIGDPMIHLDTWPTEQ